MTIHKEGTVTLVGSSVILTIVNVLLWYFTDSNLLSISTLIVSVVLFLLFLQFFRLPKREVTVSDTAIIAPADGKVVVIEEIEETEYFKDRRIQVSIFMSPFNVHVNSSPINGIIKYFKYHPGLFLVAWNPKSSTENERTSMIVERNDGKQIMVKQIAGAVARRICWYKGEGDTVAQGKEYGFIKFGSRVDVILPLGTEIKVKLNQKTRGQQTVIAELK